MKKFKFSLATVLSYKQQILESLQAEHAIIIASVHTQEEKIQKMQLGYENYSKEYSTRCAQGMDIRDVLGYQAGLRAREKEIEHEVQVLKELKQKEEAKRSEVVAAKQDTSSLEKLQEKKRSAYDAEVAKQEERFIEEFVTSRWSAAQ